MCAGPGSGEIDEEEFTSAYEQKGELWKQQLEQQNAADAGDELVRAIDEVKAKLLRKTKQKEAEEDAMRKQKEGGRAPPRSVEGDRHPTWQWVACCSVRARPC